jgi:small-conductance mechanosensitive channel
MSSKNSTVHLFSGYPNNLGNMLYSFVALIIVYGFYKFSSKQINRLAQNGRLDRTASFLLRRIFLWSSIFIVIAFTVAQFGIRIDLIAGLLVLAGGTVLGFAAMTTIGNAIAGLILMVSRPFKIGERLSLDDQFLDVESIDLIYTKMKTPDNVIVSIPNQVLIQTKVTGFGKDRIIRRRHTITVGYDEPYEKVESALLEAARRVKGTLEEPEPFVWVTEFQNYAVEYTLFVFIDDSKQIQEIDSLARKSILKTCESHGIDISTPSLFRTLT